MVTTFSTPALSFTVTLMGPSTLVPGVTLISPVFESISTGTFWPSSSIALIVAPSWFLTIRPVDCLSSVGSTFFLLLSFIESLSGFIALAFDVSVGADSLPAVSTAFALTSLPSFTLSAGIVITPVSALISNPSGASAGRDHLPVSGSFVAFTVTAWSDPSGVYVTLTSFVSSSVGGVTVTLPSSFAFTVGAPGASLSFSTSLYPVIVSWDPSG